MSHHASGPNFGFPRGDARLDMTDLYAFPNPGDPGRSILILNVHPSFRLDSPESTTTEPFAPGALYEIKIDTNGDAIADICYSVQFASSEDGKQAATVRRIQGARPVSEANLPWPATCVSPAAKKPFCRSLKWGQVWCLEGAQWHGCRV